MRQISTLAPWSGFFALALLALQGCATTLGVPAHDDVMLPIRVTANADDLKRATSRPTIIYLHGCSGLDGVYKEWAKTISSWGYNVVQPDSLTPRGVKNTCTRTGPLKVNNYDRLADLDMVADWVAKQPWHSGKIGAIGFSMGGTAVMNAANEGGAEGYGSYENKHLSAVVAYYPACSGLHARTPTIPVQVHVGEADDWTPAKRCVELKEAGTADVHFYADSFHAFDVIGLNTINSIGSTVKYNSDAAILAERKTKQFFDEHLKN